MNLNLRWESKMNITEKIYPEKIKQILTELGMTEQEAKNMIELLTFSFIAHL